MQATEIQCKSCRKVLSREPDADPRDYYANCYNCRVKSRKPKDKPVDLFEQKEGAIQAPIRQIASLSIQSNPGLESLQPVPVK